MPSAKAAEGLLAKLLANAEAARREERHDRDGHYQAASGQWGVYRVSVRYNRHGRREVAVSRPSTPNGVAPAALGQLSEAYRKVVGSRLKVAYTEPRHYAEGKGGALHWAVLHTDEAAQQQRLM